MTTLADRLSRIARLVGCIERSTDDPQVLVAARCILDEVTGAKREIAGRSALRVEPTQGRATGRFKGRSHEAATLPLGGTCNA